MSLPRLDVEPSPVSELLERLEWARVELAQAEGNIEDLADRLRDEGLGVCRACYCTDLTACDPPCSWVESDLCSECGAA